MRRSKRDKIKNEKPEPSTSKPVEAEQHDLAYFIHDRVALIQQVFAVLSPKELKSMAPGVVSHLSITEMQELCLEELLGISSKRLCATMDGAEPPSNTESSSSDEAPPLETISLDSISSDEAPLEEVPQKSKKHKHKKSKKRKRKHHTESSDSVASVEPAVATITAFELLQNEVLKAQMEKQKISAIVLESATHSRRSSDEVEIKEEPPEVLVISSDDETDVKETENLPSSSKEPDNTVTKQTNNLIVTVPQQSSNRKITLNRTKSAKPSVSNSENVDNVARCEDSTKNKNTSNTRDVAIETTNAKNISDAKTKTIASKQVQHTNKSATDEISIEKEKKAKKKHRKRERKQADKTLSDPDEITLQLSDSEMRMFEEFGKKSSEKSSSSSEDAENSSDSNEERNPSRKSLESTQNKKTDRNVESQKTDSNTKISKSVANHEELSQKSNKTTQSDIQRTDVEITPNKSSKDCDIINGKTLDNVTEKSIDQSTSKTSDTKPIDKRVSLQEIGKSQIMNRQTEIDNATDKASQSQRVEEKLQREKDEEISKDKRSKSKSRTKSIDNEKAKFTTKTKTKSRNSIRKRQELSEGEISDDDDTLVIKKVKNLVREERTLSEGEISDDKSRIDSIRRNSNIQEIDISEISDDNFEAIDENPKPNQGHIRSERESSNETANAIEKPNENSLTEAKISDKHCKALKKCKSKNRNSTERESMVIEILDHELSKSINNSKNKKRDFVTDKDSTEVEIVDDSPKFKGRDYFRSENKSSEREPQPVELLEKRPHSELVFISDEESSCKRNKKNFVVKTDDTSNKNKGNSEQKTKTILSDDDVYEILETFNDDSSDFEVNGCVILSKEPTTEEIQALSAKVDEIERQNVITNEEIVEHERLEELKRVELREADQIGDISWRDRYLQSTKVKKVMTVSKLLNALRKKNKEVKNKLEEVKHIIEEISEKTEAKAASVDIEEGSLQHYNLLQGSTKYVNPVKEKILDENKTLDYKEVIKTQQESNQIPPVNKEIIKDSPTEHIEGNQENSEAKVTEEMAKEAKKLFKMYKRLVRYNDMYREKDPHKKKKKKTKSKRKKSSKKEDSARNGEVSKQGKYGETDVCSENDKLSGETTEKCENDETNDENDKTQEHRSSENDKLNEQTQSQCENDKITEYNKFSDEIHKHGVDCEKSSDERHIERGDNKKSADKQGCEENEESNKVI